jgi:hypothetical protein
MLITSKLFGKFGCGWARGVPTRSTSKGDEYRCPACAEMGGDGGGQHLIVFKERPTFACVAYPGDMRHRSIIWNRVGDKTKGRPEPIIPLKIEQKNTFIGKHVAALQIEAEDVRRREARIREEARARLLAERDKMAQPQHIDTKSNIVQVGTFGTVISCSSNMPPPPINRVTTVYNGGGYAPPICEKASQTSQAMVGHRQRGDGDIEFHEFDATDLGVVFDTRRTDWKKQYYWLWKQKYNQK